MTEGGKGCKENLPRTTHKSLSAFVRVQGISRTRKNSVACHEPRTTRRFSPRVRGEARANFRRKFLRVVHGGEGGIRTLGTPKGAAIFETARFNHSRTSPFSTVSDFPRLAPFGRSLGTPFTNTEVIRVCSFTSQPLSHLSDLLYYITSCPLRED